ncbi:hypothetical protein [Nonomuraea dietziae]|uniref:Uncharacterized protein n=2 Tax=Nonomuraea dietziae TaxID=65515 RepID=A0A7W5VIR4_9ACTN|nr:hypothetical protein [Nonomuraea dietziae]
MMNVREPDWTYVARSLGKVLAVTAVLSWLSARSTGFWGCLINLDDERMAQVYATAARVANPGQAPGARLPPGWGTAGDDPHAVGGAAQGRSQRGEGRYEIVEDLFGVRAPSLDGPSGDLADAIAVVEADPGADTESTEKARKTRPLETRRPA